MLGLVVLAGSLGLSFGERTEPQSWAKIWGGPTEGPTPLSLRIELIDATRVPTGTPRPPARLALPARLVVTSALGQRSELPIDFDTEGVAFVQVPRHERDPTVSVWRGAQLLVTGPLRLTREEFWAKRRTRGGWLRGKGDGALVIQVGCRNGIMALGHAGELGIQIATADGKPVSTELRLQFEGLETRERIRSASVHSDHRGQAIVSVIPTDLSASLRVLVGNADPPRATYFSSVPIESSATVGRLRDGRIFVESWIPKPKVYFSLVNDQGRWAAGSIDLVCGTSGSCHAEAPLDPLALYAAAPAWLMLGSEPALDGPNVVGWPVATSTPPFVSESVTVNDRLLLDGRAAAIADAKRDAATRLNRIAFGMGLASLILLLAIVVPLVRARKNAELLYRWSAVEKPILLERRPTAAVAVLLLLVLALAALFAWAKTRLFGG